MTDKQIIIDGVDVNSLYSDQIACMNRYEVANLFIKTVEKLASKEQECEELKENLPNAITRLMGELDQLKAELEQEKNWHKTSDEISKANSEYTAKLKAEKEELEEQIKKHNDDMFKNPPEKRFYCKGCTLPYISKKLKQTLTEIKEIAEENDELLQGYHKEWANNKIILEKISEVEDETTK